MSLKYSYELNGIEDLALALKENANLDRIKKVVALNGSELQQSAVRAAPYDTGFLARSIEMNLIDDGMTAQIIPSAHYAMYQEYGTRYMSGTPFMRPALIRQNPIFIKDLERYME